MIATGESEGIIGAVAVTTPVTRHESYFLRLGRVPPGGADGDLLSRGADGSLVCMVERGRVTMAQLYRPDGRVVNSGALSL